MVTFLRPKNIAISGFFFEFHLVDNYFLDHEFE